MDGLPVSRLINVSVNLAPQLASFPNFNTCLLLTDSDVIDVTQRLREYSSVTEVATDFGSDGPEYAFAVLWFGQTPAPQTLLIGRWAKTASAGQLIGGTVSAANQLMAAWTGIANGAFKASIDGVGPVEYGGLDFSAVENMNAIAAVIESGFPGGDATCVWDSENERFVITSGTTGAASSISFLSAPDAGTDISGMMAGLEADGAYTADGVDAQTPQETVVLFDDRFGNQFYGLVIPQITDNADAVEVAELVEAMNDPPHFYGITSQEAGAISALSTTDLAYLLSQVEGLNHTAVQYSSSSPYAIGSALARILTTNWQANNSTITLMYKDEPGVEAEELSTTEANAVQDKNCNVFVAYNNETAIIQYGVSASGQYVDSVIGCDWLRAAIQTALYNTLYGTTTKIPQTDAGMHTLATQIEAICTQAVANGLLAPGVWSAQGFGQLKSGDYLPKGFYVYAPPISQQSAEDRAARKSVAFQVAAKLGGAVHTVDVTVDVQS
jgi:hypothetical protein